MCVQVWTAWLAENPPPHIRGGLVTQNELCIKCIIFRREDVTDIIGSWPQTIEANGRPLKSWRATETKERPIKCSGPFSFTVLRCCIVAVQIIGWSMLWEGFSFIQLFIVKSQCDTSHTCWIAVLTWNTVCLSVGRQLVQYRPPPNM